MERQTIIAASLDPDYQPVPAKRTFTIKARIKFTGRMNPLPYDLEEPEAPTQAPS
jgi:hypothetical protein